MNELKTEQAPNFLEVFRGTFQGVLRWHQLDQVWAAVLADHEAGWYLYAVGELPPAHVATGEQVGLFVRELDALLRREHQEDYCGIVYVDSFQQPSFIKVFDPNNLGSTCGSHGSSPLPGWILCKLLPVDLPSMNPVPKNRQRWWAKLFAGHGNYKE